MLNPLTLDRSGAWFCVTLPGPTHRGDEALSEETGKRALSWGRCGCCELSWFRGERRLRGHSVGLSGRIGSPVGALAAGRTLTVSRPCAQCDRHPSLLTPSPLSVSPPLSLPYGFFPLSGKDASNCLPSKDEFQRNNSCLIPEKRQNFAPKWGERRDNS